MIFRVRLVLYGVLPLCVLGVALRPTVLVQASAAVDATAISERFFTLLPGAGPFAAEMQLAAAGKNNVGPEIKLPDGPGKDVTVRLCSKCHSTDVWAQQRHTREKWSSIMDNMVSRGLEASDDQLDDINNYLATYFGPPPAKDASAQPSSADSPK